MNKTQLTKGLNKLGKIVKDNERDLRNVSDEDIYAIFPQAEDVEVDECEIKFYLGEYTGRVTKKEVECAYGKVKAVHEASSLIVNIAINRDNIEIIANAMVEYTSELGYLECESVDVKIITLEKEPEIEPVIELEVEKNREIIDQLKTLSCGTMGTLLREMGYTGETTYDVTDQLYEELIYYCEAADKKFSCWQEVFNDYKNNRIFTPRKDIKQDNRRINMKKIQVARDNKYGKLDNAIVETLMEEGILEDTFWGTEVYNVNFYRKNNRANGKQFIIVHEVDEEKILLAYYIKDVYRFNYWQECTLLPIKDDKELDMLLTSIM